MQDEQEIAPMPPITGTIQGGLVLPDGPLDLPEGTRVAALTDAHVVKKS